MTDAFGIVSNHEFGECLPIGAQCWLAGWNCGNGHDRERMWCRKSGSRWIEKWIATDRLVNWRVKFVPPHLRDHVLLFDSRKAAEESLGDIFWTWDITRAAA